MILKALLRFNDKETGEKRFPGDVFEVSESRGREFLADPRNVAEEVREKAPKKAEEPKAARKKAPAKRTAKK